MIDPCQITPTLAITFKPFILLCNEQIVNGKQIVQKRYTLKISIPRLSLQIFADLLALSVHETFLPVIALTVLWINVYSKGLLEGSLPRGVIEENQIYSSPA